MFGLTVMRREGDAWMKRFWFRALVLVSLFGVLLLPPQATQTRPAYDLLAGWPSAHQGPSARLVPEIFRRTSTLTSTTQMSTPGVVQDTHYAYLPIIRVRGIELPPGTEPPRQPATARYVRWNWNEFGNYDIGGEQRFVRLAYKRGYDTSRSPGE